MRANLYGGISGFFLGLGEPWRGLRFMIRHPSLWPYVVLPFLICLLFYAGAIWLGWYFMDRWLEGAFTSEAVGWRIVEYILIGLYWILVLVVSAIAFVPLAALVASPFNDLLSEKTEKIYLNVSVDEPFSIRNLIRAIKVGIKGEIARTIKVAVLLLLAFSLNIIPVIGSVASTILSTAITIRFLSLEFTSFSMDRRLFTWPQKQDYLRRYRAATIGFGAMAFVIMLVPVVNAFFIPVSAIAGTLLFCDTELRRGA